MMIPFADPELAGFRVIGNPIKLSDTPRRSVAASAEARRTHARNPGAASKTHESVLVSGGSQTRPAVRAFATSLRARSTHAKRSADQSRARPTDRARTRGQSRGSPTRLSSTAAIRRVQNRLPALTRDDGADQVLMIWSRELIERRRDAQGEIGALRNSYDDLIRSTWSSASSWRSSVTRSAAPIVAGMTRCAFTRAKTSPIERSSSAIADRVRCRSASTPGNSSRSTVVMRDDVEPCDLQPRFALLQIVRLQSRRDQRCRAQHRADSATGQAPAGARQFIAAPRRRTARGCRRSARNRSKSATGQHQRRGVDVRMKRDALGSPQFAIEIHAHVMCAIVDQSERRDRARRHAADASSGVPATRNSVCRRRPDRRHARRSARLVCARITR